MLKSIQVPSVFWGEAVCTAVYVLNRSRTKALNNKTPFEAWHGKKPKVSHLKVFGCVANVKLVGPGQSKLSDRSVKIVFIGYESGTKGYKLYNPTTRKLVVSRDVIFGENKLWNWTNAGSNTVEQETETFIVHYDQTDQNPTIEDFAQNEVPHVVQTEGEISGAGGGFVDPLEATPTHGGTQAQFIHHSRLQARVQIVKLKVP